MGTIGDDPFGHFMLDDLNSWGVDTSCVKIVPDTISFHAVVLLNQHTKVEPVFGTGMCLNRKQAIYMKMY